MNFFLLLLLMILHIIHLVCPKCNLTIFGKFRFECDRNFMVTQSQELIHRMFTDLHTIDCHSILVTKEPFLEFLHLASKPGKFSSPMHKS